MLPDSMQGSPLYGVELEEITGRIAKQLYPDANIKRMGFEQAEYSNDFFDVVIGNKLKHNQEFLMKLGNQVFSEKKEAGIALLEQCKSLR